MEPSTLGVQAPQAFCWTACEAFTFVAFGQASKIGTNWELPQAQWSLPWKQWPEPWLGKALAEIETGTPWQPHDDDWPPPDVDNTRAYARLLMKATGASAGVLLGAWKADCAKQERNEAAFLQAWHDVMQAIKAGRVTVWARPASRQGTPKLSAVHEQLGLQLFMGPRVIDPFGWVVFDERAGDSFDSVKYEGPWFDEARFSEAELRALWPALLPPPDPYDKPHWTPERARDWIAKRTPLRPADATRVLREAVEQGNLAVWGQVPGRDAAGNPTSEGQGALVLVLQHLLNGELRNPDVGFEGGVLGPRPGTAAWNRNRNQFHRCWYSTPGVPGNTQLSGPPASPARYPLYAGVCFVAADVRRLWPEAETPPNASPSDQPAPTVAGACPARRDRAKATYSDSALRAWFVLRVNTWPKGKALPSGKVDRAEAAAYFDALPTRDRFRQIRAEKTSAAWRKMGPRSGSK